MCVFSAYRMCQLCHLLYTLQEKKGKEVIIFHLPCSGLAGAASTLAKVQKID